MTLAADAVNAIPREYNFAADILDRNLKAGRADKPVFIDPRGSWTYGQLADRVARFAGALRALGVQREERILICLLDTIDWPTAFLGALKAGVVAVPVNTLMTEDDYRFMLADSRARMLVVSDALYPKFANLIGECPGLKHVVVSGDNAQGQKSFEDLIAGADNDPSTAPTTRDDIAFWLYTSGSTGKPKGAVHVHADLKLTDDLYGGPYFGLTEQDVCYSVAKLFFAYGLGNALTFPMSAGATTVLLPDRPTPDGVAALLRKHPVTVFYAVPTFYAAFLASPNAPQKSEVKIRCCVSAGEALPEDVGKRWLRPLRRRHSGRHRLDRDAAHLPVSNRAGDVKYGTTGKPVPGYACKIVDDDGLPVQARRDGRTPDQRADQRDDVLEQPRAVAEHIPRRMDALGRQVYRRQGRLFRLLRPPRRHAPGVRPICLAVRGRGRPANPF